VDALLAALKQYAVVVKTSTGVSTIRRNGGETVTITTKSGDIEHFDGVIGTVPSSVFAAMVEGDIAITNEYLGRLKSVDYLDAVVMVFRTTQTITDAFWYNIKDPRVPFLTLLSTSALAGTEQFGGSHVYFVGAYIPRNHAYMSDACDIETEWKAGLSVMFPHFDPTQIQELKITKFKDAQHIVDIGYEENKLVPFQTPIEGVYLANFSQIYPDDRGTNFAVRDGRRVATLFNESASS
jgi:protoporphyrinogen oxidase